MRETPTILNYLFCSFIDYFKIFVYFYVHWYFSRIYVCVGCQISWNRSYRQWGELNPGPLEELPVLLTADSTSL